MDGINLDGLRKMLRDLRVLDFIKSKLDIYMNEEGELCFYNRNNQDGDCDELRIYDLPEYIKNDIYEWLEED